MTLLDLGCLPPGGPLVVAVSGGADSAVLLDLLAGVGRWRLCAWHLDHRLRSDSVRDMAVLRTLVERLETEGKGPIRLICESADINGLARFWRCGLEEAGRRERYRRLVACARAVGASQVATAHHRDDQIETILMNLLRGAGPRGMAGMRPGRRLAEGVDLVRPLLAQPRDRLRAYAVTRGLQWCEDASNQDPRFRRNQIRHRILPVLEAGAPGFGEALLSAAARGCGGDPALEPWAEILRGLGVEPDRGRLRRLAHLAAGPMGRRYACGGWLFRRACAGLVWEREMPLACDAETVITGSGRWRRGDQEMDLALLPAPDDPRVPASSAWLGATTVLWPLTWRAPRPGERWQPLGAPGSQTVSKSLAARGVPSRQRRHHGLLADHAGVVWVPGHGPAERCRVTEAGSPALRCALRPAETG